MYNLKAIRREKKMSQQELSAKSGVSRAIIWRLESERDYVTTTSTLRALAAALDVHVSKIFLG